MSRFMKGLHPVLKKAGYPLIMNGCLAFLSIGCSPFMKRDTPEVPGQVALVSRTAYVHDFGGIEETRYGSGVAQARRDHQMFVVHALGELWPHALTW